MQAVEKTDNDKIATKNNTFFIKIPLLSGCNNYYKIKQITWQ